ncbi:MAG: hypothetical protein AB8C02_01600 [Halioglobus sp.]
MKAQKASFYERDPEVCTSDLDDETPRAFKGENRRQQHRRKHPERRSEVRFDLKDGDRREVDGRRDGDATPKFW